MVGFIKCKPEQVPPLYPLPTMGTIKFDDQTPASFQTSSSSNLLHVCNTMTSLSFLSFLDHDKPSLVQGPPPLLVSIYVTLSPCHHMPDWFFSFRCHHLRIVSLTQSLLHVSISFSSKHRTLSGTIFVHCLLCLPYKGLNCVITETSVPGQLSGAQWPFNKHLLNKQMNTMVTLCPKGFSEHGHLAKTEHCFLR